MGVSTILMAVLHFSAEIDSHMLKNMRYKVLCLERSLLFYSSILERLHLYHYK